MQARGRKRLIFIADSVKEKKIKLAHLTRPSSGSSRFSVTRFQVKTRRFRGVSIENELCSKNTIDAHYFHKLREHLFSLVCSADTIIDNYQKGKKMTFSFPLFKY